MSAVLFSVYSSSTRHIQLGPGHDLSQYTWCTPKRQTKEGMATSKAEAVTESVALVARRNIVRVCLDVEIRRRALAVDNLGSKALTGDSPTVGHFDQ
jgi:hypothetical protein